MFGSLPQFSRADSDIPVPALSGSYLPYFIENQPLTHTVE